MAKKKKYLDKELDILHNALSDLIKLGISDREQIVDMIRSLASDFESGDFPLENYIIKD